MEAALPKYQYLPSLSLDEYEALRESVRENGVIEPVIVDESGAVIDGHHRVKACEELGAEYPTRVVGGLTEEQKQDLSLELNMHRRHLTKEQKKELALDLRGQRWAQERIGRALGVSQKTISNWLGLSNFTSPDQPSPKREPAEDKEKASLKEQVAYYEKLARGQEEEIRELARTKKAFDELAFDRNQAREEARAMAKELERLRDAAPEKEVVTVRVEDAGATAAKLAELERALAEAEAERRRLESEREEIRRERGDMEKLERECQMLEGRKRHIQAEIVSASVMVKIQKRLFSEHDAFVHGAAALRIVTEEILERDDCAGLSVEALEGLERDIAKVGVCVRELIPAIHAVIEKIRGGGALRVVKG